MGIIIRQSLKNSFINYLGVIIGVISTIFIYPLDKTTYGLVQFLMGAAMMVYPFLVLGANSINLRFFPEFENAKNGHNGYWGFLLTMIAVGFVIFSTLFHFFAPDILWLYREKSPLFQAYIPYILPLALLIGLLNFNISFAANFKRIAIPAAFNILIKLSLPALILLYYYEWISLQFLVYGVIANFAVALCGILIYLFWLKETHWRVNWSFLTKDRRKRIANYAAYGMVAGVGGIIAFRIDSVMVPSLIDFKSNGVYNIALFIGNAIAIPAVAILSIASPIISKSFQDNKLDEIKVIYSKSSINLLIVGLLLFGLVLPNVEDLFSIMPNPEEMTSGYWVVFFIGLAKVIEMGTSVNHQIIGHSKFYGLNLVMIAILAVSNVALNWWLIQIPSLGIIGAAMATCISLSIYNFIKIGIIYWKLKIQPFSLQTIWLLGIGLILFIVFSIIHLSWHPIINIGVKSFLFTLIYLPTIYFLNFSPDLNHLVQRLLGLQTEK